MCDDYCCLITLCFNVLQRLSVVSEEEDVKQRWQTHHHRHGAASVDAAVPAALRAADAVDSSAAGKLSSSLSLSLKVYALPSYSPVHAAKHVLHCRGNPGRAIDPRLFFRRGKLGGGMAPVGQSIIFLAHRKRRHARFDSKLGYERMDGESGSRKVFFQQSSWEEKDA